MHTAYTFGVQHIILYYIWSLPTSEETKFVALKGHQTNTQNTQQKRKLQIQLLFTLTASSKYVDDFSPSEYVLDICCDSRWRNISKSQAVYSTTSTSTITHRKVGKVKNIFPLPLISLQCFLCYMLYIFIA